MVAECLPAGEIGLSAALKTEKAMASRAAIRGMNREPFINRLAKVAGSFGPKKDPVIGTRRSGPPVTFKVPPVQIKEVEDRFVASGIRVDQEALLADASFALRDGFIYEKRAELEHYRGPYGVADAPNMANFKKGDVGPFPDLDPGLEVDDQAIALGVSTERLLERFDRGVPGDHLLGRAPRAGSNGSGLGQE